jgi:hypothetical protein
VKRELQTLVWQRAGNACEYCLMPAGIYDVKYQIDHVIAEQHLGQTVLENLALACYHCNLHKGPNIAGIDPQTGSLTPLFNPRNDLWKEHFTWAGPEIVGQTPAGRATIIVLALNDPLIVAVRASLIKEGLFRASSQQS